MKVVFAPEVEEDLYELIEILIEKEYLGTYPFAIMKKYFKIHQIYLNLLVIFLMYGELVVYL